MGHALAALYYGPRDSFRHLVDSAKSLPGMMAFPKPEIVVSVSFFQGVLLSAVAAIRLEGCDAGFVFLGVLFLIIQLVAGLVPIVAIYYALVKNHYVEYEEKSWGGRLKSGQNLIQDIKKIGKSKSIHSVKQNIRNAEETFNKIDTGGEYVTASTKRANGFFKSMKDRFRMSMGAKSGKSGCLGEKSAMGEKSVMFSTPTDGDTDVSGGAKVPKERSENGKCARFAPASPPPSPPAFAETSCSSPRNWKQYVIRKALAPNSGEGSSDPDESVHSKFLNTHGDLFANFKGPYWWFCIVAYADKALMAIITSSVVGMAQPVVNWVICCVVFLLLLCYHPHNKITTNIHIISNRGFQTFTMFVLMLGATTDINPHDIAVVATTLNVVATVHLLIGQLLEILGKVMVLNEWCGAAGAGIAAICACCLHKKGTPPKGAAAAPGGAHAQGPGVQMLTKKKSLDTPPSALVVMGDNTKMASDI